MAAESPDAAGRTQGRTATPVSAGDVQRVVARALAQGTRRIRLTYGQRLAIVNDVPQTGGARV